MGRESDRGSYDFFVGGPQNDRAARILLGQSLTEWRPGRETVPLRPNLFAHYITSHWEGSSGPRMWVEQTEEVDGGGGVRLATDLATLTLSARSLSTDNTEEALRFQLDSPGNRSGEQRRSGPLVLPVIPNVPLSIRFSAESLVRGRNFTDKVEIFGAYSTMSEGRVKVKPFVRVRGLVGSQLSDELYMSHPRMGISEFVLPVPHFRQPTLFDEERKNYDPLFFLLLVPQRKLRPGEIRPSYPPREDSALLSFGGHLEIQPGKNGSPAFSLVQDDRSVWNAAVPLVIQLVMDL